MKTPEAGFTLEELRQFLEREQEAPAGYRRAVEWAQRWGCSAKRARELIRVAKDRGWVLVGRHPHEAIDGRRTWSPVYAFVLPKEEDAGN